MKHVKLTSLICGGILSLTSASLLAQQSSLPGSASSSSSSAAGQSSLGQGQSQSSSALGSSSSSLQAQQNVRLSSLLNSPVQSKDGKQIGTLRDVTVDPKSGRIEFGILSLSAAGGAGGISGQTSQSGVSGTAGTSAGASMTGKLIPVPWQCFSQSWTGAQIGSSSSATGGMGTPLVLNVDESKLANAPSFTASQWNEIQSGSFAQQVYSHFGVSPSALGTSGSSMSGHGASGSQYQQHNYGTQRGSSGTTSGTTPR